MELRLSDVFLMYAEALNEIVLLQQLFTSIIGPIRKLKGKSQVK